MNQCGYRYLEFRPGAKSRQMYVKGRKLLAYDLYADSIGEEALTPQEIADDRDVPLEAVLEAIDYCEKNHALIQQEIEEDWADIKARGWDQAPLVPPDFVP